MLPFEPHCVSGVQYWIRLPCFVGLFCLSHLRLYQVGRLGKGIG